MNAAGRSAGQASRTSASGALREGIEMNMREANARYYAAHRDPIILRESELRPSTILELIDCLGDQVPHPHDRRIERLERLFVELTGTEPRQFADAAEEAADTLDETAR